MEINPIIQSLENFQGIAILLVAVWLAWKVASWKATVDSRLTGIEKAIDRLEKSFDRLEKAVETLTHKVDDVYRRITDDSEENTKVNLKNRTGCK